jgi:hypothetical protein
MTVKDLEQLGDAVDEAERRCDAAEAINMRWDEGYREIVDDLIAAKRTYRAALRKPWFDELAALEKSRFIRPSAKRVDRLRVEMERAAQRLARVTDCDRWLRSDREMLEVAAADEAADSRHDFFYAQYWHAVGDREAGIRAKRWKTRTADGVMYALAGVKTIDGERRENWVKVI